ncbi:F-box family protein [Zea mays]|uniref:F-box family protein n=1 Tax=Zea mays TaxID=4577 RepID=A0A1D6IMZ3_MAIZE|nr:F-box family protein [Zea mays]
MFDGTSRLLSSLVFPKSAVSSVSALINEEVMLGTLWSSRLQPTTTGVWMIAGYLLRGMHCQTI